MKLKTIDLCAGIGGIRRGFELAGDYTNIASAEIDEMACKTYEHLYHENVSAAISMIFLGLSGYIARIRMVVLAESVIIRL